MKFLKEDGTVEEGIMLTDEQDATREALEEYIHVKVCKHAYHAGYEGKKPCASLAALIATKFALPPRSVIDAMMDEIAPKASPATVTDVENSAQEVAL